MTKLHFLTALSFGVHSPRRSPYRALLSDHENKRFVIIVLREEPQQADGRLGKALQHVVNRVWDKNNPFSWGDESPSHRVVALEIDWAAIVGIDYRCPLHDDGKLVLEARQVVKRCFKTVEDVRDFYSPRTAAGISGNVLRSFHSAAPTPHKMSFEGWQGGRPLSCATQGTLATWPLSPRAVRPHSSSHVPSIAGLVGPFHPAEFAPAAGPTTGANGLLLGRRSISERVRTGGARGVDGGMLATRMVGSPSQGSHTRSLSTSRMSRSTGMLCREGEASGRAGVGGATSRRSSCSGFASADEGAGGSRRQLTAAVAGAAAPPAAGGARAAGAGSSGSGACGGGGGGTGRAARRRLKLSGQEDTALREAAQRVKAGYDLAASALAESQGAIAGARAAVVRLTHCEGSPSSTTTTKDNDSMSSARRKARSTNDLVGMAASAGPAEAEAPGGGTAAAAAGAAAAVLPSWYGRAPGGGSSSGEVGPCAGCAACCRSVVLDGGIGGYHTHFRRLGSSWGPGDWEAVSDSGGWAYDWREDGSGGDSCMRSGGCSGSGSGAGAGTGGIAAAMGGDLSGKREQLGGRSARPAKAGEQARRQRGGGSGAKGIWATWVSGNAGSIGLNEAGASAASRGVEVPRASRWTRPSASYASSTLVLSFRDPFLPQELRRFVKSDMRLLKLYESGLPPWAIFMPCYGLPYRPWMRRVLWLLFIAVSIFSMGCGFYDLYKNVPFLKQVVTAVASRMYLPAAELFEWLERHTQIRMSILLTYLFSKSPLLMSLMRMLRSLAALLQQLLQPVAAALSTTLQPVGSALQVAAASVSSGAAAMAAASWQVTQPIVTVVAMYGGRAATLAAAVLGPPARAFWAVAVLVAQLVRLVAALIGMVLVGPLQLACSVVEALSWAGAAAAAQMAVAWDALRWAVQWVVTLGRAAQRVAPAVRAGARAAAHAAGGASVAVGGAGGGFSGGMAVWQWLGLEVVGAYNAVRLSFVQAFKSAQAVMNFCVTVAQTAVQHRVSLLLQIQRFITRQKERLPPAVAASVPLPAFVSLPSFDMPITDLLDPDAVSELGPAAAATAAEHGLYSIEDMILLEPVRQGPGGGPGGGTGSSSGGVSHGGIIPEPQHMYGGSDAVLAGWRSTGGAGGGRGQHDPIPIPPRPGRGGGGMLRRRHVSAVASAGSAGAMYGMIYGRLDAVDEEELDEDSYGFGVRAQGPGTAPPGQQRCDLPAAGALAGSLTGRQHAAALDAPGRLTSGRASWERQRLLAVQGSQDDGWRSYGGPAWPASAPAAEAGSRWAAAWSLAEGGAGGAGGDRAASAGGGVGSLLGSSLPPLCRRHSAELVQGVEHGRPQGLGYGVAPLPGEAALAPPAAGRQEAGVAKQPQEHQQHQHQQHKLPQHRKQQQQHKKQQKHNAGQSSGGSTSLAAPDPAPVQAARSGSGRCSSPPAGLAASETGGALPNKRPSGGEEQGTAVAAGASTASAVRPARSGITTSVSATACEGPTTAAAAAAADGTARGEAHAVTADTGSAARGSAPSVVRRRPQAVPSGGSSSAGAHLGGVVVPEGCRLLAERVVRSAAQGKAAAAAGECSGDIGGPSGGNNARGMRPPHVGAAHMSQQPAIKAA